MTSKRSATAQAVADLFDRSSAEAACGTDSEQWQAFVAAGFPWAAVPQGRGGAGGAVSDAVDIVREIGRAGAAVPAGETDLLGEWLLREANLPSVPGLIAVAPGNGSDDLRIRRDRDTVILTGTASRVAWASQSCRFVALVSDGVENHAICVPVERLSIAPGQSIAGESRDFVTADDVNLAADEIAVLPTLDTVELRARGAATRAVLIQGAVDAVVELVSAYCATRKQFGRRLRDFQVVAHQQALLREHTTLMRAAVQLASSALDGSGSWEDAAAAKIIAGEVATHIAKVAHQLHGAIGVSEEYVLHRYTRRLWAWRDEYGGEYEWSKRLGAGLILRGPQALWPWVSESNDEAM